MATLTGKKIKNTYDALLKLSDNDNLTTTAKQVTDGFGNNAPLWISTTQIGIGVTPEVGYDLHVYSDAKVGGNLTITGDLTVNGTTTTVDTDTLRVEDPLIELARLNTSADSVDIGFYGKYHPSGTTLYSGLFRDAGDDKYKLFKDLQEEPTTTVNTSGTGYTKADLVIGDLEATGGNFTGIVYVDTHLEVENSSGFGFLEVGGSSGAYIDLKSPFSDDFDLRLYTAGTNAQINALNGELNITANTNINLQHQGTDVLVMSSTGVAVTGTGSFTGQVTIPETPVADTDAASKGYVDGLVEGQDTLAEILANGNTTGGTDIDVSAGDDINLTDTSEIHLGASADLVIKHNGTLGSIANKTGTLQIVQNTDDGDIKFFCDDGSGGTVNYLQIDGSEQRIKVFKEMRLSDNVELRLGFGNDLRLYHNETNSNIINYTGHLYITNNADDKDIIFASDNGSGGTTAYYYLDGSLQMNRFPVNVQLDDSVELRLGTNQDLRLYHTGTTGWIRNYTGHLYIDNLTDNGHIIFRSDDGSGGVTEYLKIDGSQEKIIVSKPTEITGELTASTLLINGTANREFYIDTTNPDHLKKNQNLVLSADPDNSDASTVIAFHIDGSEKASLNSTGNFSANGRGTFSTLTLTDGNDDLTFTQSSDDWTINNAQQDNGITIYDGTAGVGINYNGTEYFKVNTSGVYVPDNIDFYVDTNLLYVDATNNRVGIGKAAPDYKLEVNGQIASNNYIIAGLGNGGTALTHNDGGGNANVTFNHVSETPEQDGSSGRIAVTTDSTTAKMTFELADNVTDGVSVDTPISFWICTSIWHINRPYRHFFRVFRLLKSVLYSV
jgi:hypothetical protein